jgi:hypothetical protein
VRWLPEGTELCRYGCPLLDAELLEDAGHVSLDGRLRDPQSGRDLFVGQLAGDFPLARRELVPERLASSDGIMKRSVISA